MSNATLDDVIEAIESQVCEFGPDDLIHAELKYLRELRDLQRQLGEANEAMEEWRAVAQMAGEYCGETVGPPGYYEMTPLQFKEWFATTVAYKAAWGGGK